LLQAYARSGVLCNEAVGAKMDLVDLEIFVLVQTFLKGGDGESSLSSEEAALWHVRKLENPRLIQ
jgi:hypothetical protein